MTSMLEKSHSKKAKTFHRFNRKQDHGDAAMEKGHDHYYGTWENLYDRRGIVSADKHHLADNMSDTQDDTDEIDMFPQDESEKSEFNKLVEEYPEYIDISEQFSRDLDDFYRKELDIDDIVPRYQHELERQSGYMPTYEQAETLFYELLLAKEEDEDTDRKVHLSDDAHLNYSEAELGMKSKSDVRKSLARRATLDHEYDSEDYGDDTEVGMRVHNIR